MLKVLKRVLAIELCLIMFLALLPIGALAEEPTPPVVDPPAEVSESPVVETPVIEKKEIVEEKKDEIVEEKKDEIIEEKKDEIVTEKKDETVEEKKDEIVGDKKDEVVEDKKDEIVDEKDKDEEETDEEEETILRHGQQEEESPASAPVLSLNKSSVSLAKGDEETLTCTATIDGESADVSIDWSSSDESVATVDGGIVTAFAAGEATITASAEGATNVFCKVTVTGEPEEEVGLFMANFDVAPMDLDDGANEEITYYTVTFYVDGVGTPQQVAAGGAITKPADPEKAGYEFAGWSPEVPETMPTENPSDLDFSADFTAKDYTITYLVDGVETKQTYACDADVIPPADPEKEGFDFVKWTPALPSSMPANDLTVSAEFAPISYTITYVADGVETVVAYDCGAPVATPADPEKEGYTFTGWDATIPAVMPAEHLTITANFAIATYTITYVVDGVETKVPYEFGAAVAQPANPTKEDYTFTDWDLAIPATMPAHDMTITAQFAIDTYTITYVAGTNGTVSRVSETNGVDTAAAGCTAYPNTGYVFENWTQQVGGKVTEVSKSATFVPTVKENAIYVANFVEGTASRTEYYTLTVGETKALTDGNEDSTWRNSDGNVLTLSGTSGSSITVTAKAAGTATVTRNGNKYVFTVVPVTVGKVEISGASQVEAGQTAQYTATVTTNAPEVSGVIWSIYDAGGTTATIDENGLLTTVAGEAGTVILKATAATDASVYKLMTVQVTEKLEVESVAIWQGGQAVTGLLEMNQGSELQFAAKLTPDTLMATETVHWTASGPEGTLIDQSGKLTSGHAAGRATVTAEAGGKTASVTVDILQGQSQTITVEMWCTNQSLGSASITIPNNGESISAASLAPSHAGYAFNGLVKHVMPSKMSPSFWGGSGAMSSFSYDGNTVLCDGEPIGSGGKTVVYFYEQIVNTELGDKASTASVADWPNWDDSESKCNQHVVVVRMVYMDGSEPMYTSSNMYYWDDTPKEVRNITFTSNKANYVVDHITIEHENASSGDDQSGTISGTNSVSVHFTNNYLLYPSSEVETFIVTGYFRCVGYTVRYNATGASNSGAASRSYQETPGNIVTVQTTVTPQREGYSFGGWQYGGSTRQDGSSFVMPEANVVLTPYWIPTGDSIQYTPVTSGHVGSTDGGTVSPTSEWIMVGEDPKGSTATAKDGYTFAGWYSDAACTQRVSASASYTPAADKKGSTFYALFVSGTYTITYKNYNGVTIDVKSYAYGDAITPIPNPTRQGYTFTGWNPTVPETMPAQNLVVTAQYEAAKYAVTYQYTGEVPAGAAALPATVEYDYQASVSIAATPANVAGYTFGGWKKYGIAATDFAMPGYPVTITGKWTANTNTAYQVQHYKMQANGAYPEAPSATDNKVGKTGDFVTASARTFPGYTFDAATTGAQNQGVILGDGTLILKLYYSFVDYTITYKLAGGEISGSADNVVCEKQHIGDTTPQPSNPTRADANGIRYTFTGWSPEVAATVSGDATYTAQWSEAKIDYNVTYRYMNTPTGAPAAPNDSTATVGNTVTVAAALELTGYEFGGWTTTDATVTGGSFTMPSHDVAFTGAWTANDYTITYSVSGDVPAGYTAPAQVTGKHVGDTYTVEAVPTEDGYTFAGWKYNDTNTTTLAMPANDVTLTGVWTANAQTYTVYYREKDADPANQIAIAQTKNTTFASVITSEDEKIAITGFTYDSADTETLTIGADNTANVINLYYTRQSYGYTIHHVELGNVTNVLADDTTGTAAFGAEIDVAAAKKSIDGFAYNSNTRNITIVVEEAQNVATIYYARNAHTVTYAYSGDVPNGAQELLPAKAENIPFAQGMTVAGAPELAGYTFSGWTTADATVAEDGGFTMPDQNVTFTGTWTANEDTAYTVEHYQQNANDDGYTLADTESLTGTTGETATAAAKSYTGFTENTTTALRIPSGMITGNGGLVLKLYYDRATHTVTYAYDTTAPENAPALPLSGNYRQGATVTVAGDVSLAGYTFNGWDRTGTFEMPNNDVTITGSWEAIDYTISYSYTNTVAGAPAVPAATTKNHVGETKTRAAAPELAGYMFSGWTTADATVAEDGGFTMPSHDVAFTGTWMANLNTQYTVEFYLQGVDGTYPATATNRETRGGETDTTASVTDADKAAPTGFMLDDAAADKLYSGTITGDGKLRLKVFFKRGLYAVTYAYSGEVPTGAGDAPTEADQRYGATVMVKPVPTTPDGYTFSGWATSNAEVKNGSFTMPNAAVAFTGSFIPNTDTQYTVEFYYEDVAGGYPASATNSVARGGTTNTTASVTDADKAPAQTGFTLDDAAAHVYSGLITGNGNLRLKVFFKRNLHGITYSYTNPVIGAPALPAAESNIRVGTGKQVATAPELPGYTFSGWTTADAVVTGGSFTMPDLDVAFTGTWTPIAYTVTYQFTGTVPAGASNVLPAPLTNRHVGDPITVANAPTLDGYTFDGWYKGTEKTTSFDMPTENVTLTGSWTPIDYTVTYQYTNAAPTGASDVPAQLTGKHVGDLITVAGQPESIPAGYTFDGWYNGNTLVTSLTMPAANVTLTGSWTPIDYTVTYQYTNTVTGAPDVPAQLTGKHVGDPITVADAPTLAGYTFSGWSTTDATVANNAFDMPAKSVVISGSWTPIDYTVTYQYTNTVAGAPTVPAQLTGKHVGDGITVAAVPELTGYTFDGWKYDGAVVTSVTMPADNIVLTGTWNPRTDTKYRVEYYQQNVENDNYTLYEGFDYTGTTDALVTAEAKGYEGFTYNASVAGTLESGNILPNGTLVLKRFYDRLTYPVKYQYAGTIPANPPKLPDELRYKHGATVSVAPAAAPAPDGYTFEGWDETGTTFTMPMGAKTITGTWSMVDYTVTYQYTNTVEGAPAVPATMTGKHVGDPITVSSPLPTMTGYTFDGWYKGTDITTAFDMPANHVTLTGGWNINSHTVTYLVDGQTYGAVDTYNFGATVAPLRAKPEKVGYTFTDWQGTLPATMPDNDIVISCTSTPIDYKVTYRYTGIVPTGAPVEPAETLKNHVGDPMTVATAPTFANYTFSGWTTSDATVESGAFAMPAKNVVFSGGWTANSYDYSVEYYYNGNIDAKKTTTAQAAFGTLLSTLAPSADTITANTKRGYTYTETVVTGSVTETAANNVIRVYYLGNGRIGVTLTGFNVDYDGNTHAAVPSVSVVTDGVTETMGWDAFLAAAGAGVGITYNGSGDLPKDATKGEDVYAIAISGKPATVTIDEIPYAVTYGTATGVIKPVTLTVRPDDATITVGDPTPSPLTYAITGYVAGEDATAISGTPVITALNVQNDVAGKYDIAATAGSLAAKNYLFAYEMGTLTILPKFNVTYVYTGSVPAGVTPPASAQVGAGLPYSIAALPAAVAGYAFGDWAVTGATAAAGVFVMPENDVTITLNWQRLYQLTIQYIYAATGVVFSTLDAGMIPEGTNFGPYISPEVAGYEYDRNYVDGTMPSANLTEQVFYTAIPTPPVPPEEPPAGPPDVPPETPPEEPIPVIPTITQVEDLLTTLTDDEGIALAGPKNASWALLNLILTIATAIANVLMLIGYFGKKEEKTEAGEIYRQIKKHGLVRVLMLVPTLGAIIAFILTENMNLPMVLVDRWTVLMLIIAAIQMLMVLLGMKSDKDIDSDDFSIDSRGMTMGGK